MAESAAHSLMNISSWVSAWSGCYTDTSLDNTAEILEDLAQPLFPLTGDIPAKCGYEI